MNINKEKIDLSKQVYFYDERENVHDMLHLKKIYFQNEKMCLALVEWVLKTDGNQSFTISFLLDSGNIVDEGFECWKATNDSKWVKDELSVVQEEVNPLKDVFVGVESDNDSLLLWYGKELGIEDKLTLEDLIESHRHLRKLQIQKAEQCQQDADGGTVCDDSGCQSSIQIAKLKSMSVQQLVEFLGDYI